MEMETENIVQEKIEPTHKQEAEETSKTNSTVSKENESTSEETVTQNLSPEYIQKKVYFLLAQLGEMHQGLPHTYYLRVPLDLLASMAQALVNDTIFEIVKGLMEIQHVTENHLLKLREQVETEFKIEVQKWIEKIKDPEELGHILALMKIKHSKKLKDTDMKLVAYLDQKVHDQQATLEKAGVPGFYVTDKPIEIKTQMHLLDFILRLSQVKFDPNK